MNNKKLKYILIPAVVIVWGLVIYKTFSYTNDSPVYNFNNNSNDIKDENTEITDTFSLIADYRDPFLGRQSSFKLYSNTNNDYSQPNNSNKSNNTKKNNKTPVIKNIKWPQIKYGGLVINQKSAKMVGIMQVNGKKHLIEENNKYENVEILNLFEDSVSISYMNNYKTFYK